MYGESRTHGLEGETVEGQSSKATLHRRQFKGVCQHLCKQNRGAPSGTPLFCFKSIFDLQPGVVLRAAIDCFQRQNLYYFAARLLQSQTDTHRIRFNKH